MDEVSLKITGNYIKIYINSILHIQLPYTKEIHIQSWKQANNWYCIEFSQDGRLLEDCAYKDKNIWQQILKVWDENIE